MLSTTDIFTTLKEQGYKQTQVRHFLITHLAQTKKPSSAPELHNLLSLQIGTIHKTTVYRELDFLVSQHILVEIYFADGKKRYEICGLPHHHHLVCNNCERVEDIYPDIDLERFETKIARKKSFTILHHSLEFFGLCQLCSKC
jgi:Fur family ferric uptake transcriptional regulator